MTFGPFKRALEKTEREIKREREWRERERVSQVKRKKNKRSL